MVEALLPYEKADAATLAAHTVESTTFRNLASVFRKTIHSIYRIR